MSAQQCRQSGLEYVDWYLHDVEGLVHLGAMSLHGVQERRQHLRERLEVNARIDGPSASFYALVVDLSVGGMAVATSHALPTGSEVECEFELPTSAVVLNLRGRIVWAGSGKLGVEFLGIKDAARRLLERWLLDHRAKQDVEAEL